MNIQRTQQHKREHNRHITYPWQGTRRFVREEQRRRKYIMPSMTHNPRSRLIQVLRDIGTHPLFQRNLYELFTTWDCQLYLREDWRNTETSTERGSGIRFKAFEDTLNCSILPRRKSLLSCVSEHFLLHQVLRPETTTTRRASWSSVYTSERSVRHDSQHYDVCMSLSLILSVLLTAWFTTCLCVSQLPSFVTEFSCDAGVTAVASTHIMCYRFDSDLLVTRRLQQQHSCCSKNSWSKYSYLQWEFVSRSFN